MNPLHEDLAKGTLGEIFLQLKLLQYGVQAAPPLKDSGNDLIAIKGDIFKAIQVKTTVKDRFDFNLKELPIRYHVLALVRLVGGDNEIDWNNSPIYLMPREKVTKGSYREEELSAYSLSNEYLNLLFS